MNQAKEQAIHDAIRVAVETVVEELGVAFIRTLSMFPSASVNEAELKEAA